MWRKLVMSFAMQLNWTVGPSEPTGRSKDARTLFEAGGGQHEVDAGTAGEVAAFRR